MQKNKFLAELDRRNEDVHDLMTENQQLRAEMQQLRLKMKTHGNHGDDKTIDEPALEPVDDFLASKLKAAHAEVTSLLKYNSLLLLELTDVLVYCSLDAIFEYAEHMLK